MLCSVMARSISLGDLYGGVASPSALPHRGHEANRSTGLPFAMSGSLPRFDGFDVIADCEFIDLNFIVKESQVLGHPEA